MLKPEQITALKKHILSSEISSMLTSALYENTGKNNFYIVFLSVCDIKKRARVFHETAETLEKAWEKAEEKVTSIFKKESSFLPKWFKADIVTGYKEIPVIDLNNEIVKNAWNNYTRLGISFDLNFNQAFIEAEINGNKMLNYYSEKEIFTKKIDYNSIRINLVNINNYLKTYYKAPPIKSIPDKITTFNACGFFCGEDNIVHKLYNDGIDYGRRVVDEVDNKVVENVIVNASEYLANLIGKDGKFTYGYFPVFNNKLENYNIVRHASSLWSLINLYRMNKDDTLIPKLDSAISYMNGFIEHKDTDTAYIVERSADEIKLGGNAVAIIMYTEYMDVFKSEKYIDIIKKLANGILELQNIDTGEYYHILNFPEFSRKEKFRTVYYDGEATFALARAYTYTREQKYLGGAKAAVENFIKKNYIQYRDHWVAYSLFEVTKYIEDTRYYEFALKNADKNLKEIYNRATSYHTYLEMLMAAWRTYQRALKNNINSDYIKNYNPTEFAQTIYFRARHMLNGYFYPEYAMYMKVPKSIAGAFMVRHHNYRVRIDDIQHFIGGYYFYSIYYGEIRECITSDWIDKLNTFIENLEESETIITTSDKKNMIYKLNFIENTNHNSITKWLKIQSLGVACIGCESCFNVCNKNAIIMELDNEGYKFPVVDNKKCTRCRRCENVCPIVKSQARIKRNGNIETQINNTIQNGIIYYGITDKLIKKINDYISITGNPDMFADKPEKLNGLSSKLFGKYSVVSIDEALKHYPNADVWVTYRNPGVTAKTLLKKLPPEKIHFLEEDLEYRKGCRYLGHFMSYRKDNFSPCCVAGMNPVVKTTGSVVERVLQWEEYTTKLIDNIRNNKPNDCSKCPLLQYNFWRKTIKLDMVAFGSNNPGDVCNFKCIYCFSEQQLDKLKIDNEGFTTYEIIHQLSKMQEYNTNNFIIQLSNGEFSANKQCDKILDVLLNTKWKIQLVTNLSIYREKLFELMNTGRVTQTLVSLDAGTRETFKQVKQLDMWDRVVENLKKYPVEKANIILKYIFLEGLNDNEADINGFYETVKEVGCKRISLSSNQKLNYEPLTPKMRELTIYLIKRAKPDGVTFGTTSYLNPDDTKWVKEMYENT